MIDFLLVINKRANATEPELASYASLESLRHTRTDDRSSFCAGRTYLWVWHTSVEPFTSIGQHVSWRGAGLDLYEGQALTAGGSPIASLPAFIAAATDGILGHYVHVHIDADGSGRIDRSRLPVHQLYYAENEQVAIVSSRSLITAAGASRTTSVEFDPGFVRSVASMSIVGHYGTAFTHVRFLGADQRLSFGPLGLDVETSGAAFIRDRVQAEEYARSPDDYWDEATDVLRRSLAILDLTHDPIEFPLSGGKDSRLLLALLLASGRRDRISGAITYGPPTSPDARAAQAVCEMLRLPHRLRDDTTVSVKQDIVLADKLIAHVYVTEGEMSPLDMSPLEMTWRREPDGRTLVYGQEGGSLRNIAGAHLPDSREALKAWFDVHLAGGDVLKSLRPEAGLQNRRDVEAFLDSIESTGVPWQEAPTLHRIRYRLSRWAARTWKAANSLGFAPYVLMTPELFRMSVGAGATSRSREELHFEVMRRLDSRLVQLPFAAQSWPEETLRGAFPSWRQPQPYSWPNAVPAHLRRPTHQAVFENIEPLKRYLRRYAGPVTRSVVDFDKLDRLTRKTLTSGHYQPLWQLLQCVLLERIIDAGLGSEVDRSIDPLPPVDVLSAPT